MACGGKRFGLSPCNEKNADIFISEMSPNSSLVLSRRCLGLQAAEEMPGSPAGAPRPRRCLWLPPLRVLGPQGGAPIAHFQARWLRCSVSCILKRGNGCPGILQGQDKATAECNFCWKMCFAYNCNRHHLWLLIRTNSLLVLWDLSVWFPWHMLHLATLSLNFSLLLCSIVN